MCPETSAISQWLDTVAPLEPQHLARRLAWDGFSEDAFADWLDKGGQSGDDPVDWRTALNLCRNALMASLEAPHSTLETEVPHPFVDLWWPLRKLGCERLAALFPGGDETELKTHEQLAEALLGQVCEAGEQVLWQCFDQGPGSRLIAHLGANGPGRTRYNEFVRTQLQDGLSTFLTEFPVFGRVLGTVFALWLESSAEMLRRVRGDRAVLQRVFGVPKEHRLVRIIRGFSDPHRGGRAVAVLEFAPASRAETRRIVYKPKDMQADAAFQRLLGDLGQLGDLQQLRSLAVHAADGYGYMEYVPHRLCADVKELERFYVNAGRLTAVLHWLGCTDCHHENLIACGDQLLLIDTETLLEPNLPDHIRNALGEAAGPEPSTLNTRFQRSVLRSGLLPRWMFLGDGRNAMDISAMGIATPPLPQQMVYGWLAINTDGMMPGQVKSPSELPTSLPVGIGTRNPFAEHLDAYCQGFRQQCNDLILARTNLLATNGPLARFAGLRRRIVLRATRVYFTLHRRMLEPEALRSERGQALILEQLGRSLIVAEARPLPWPVFAAERRQMRMLDIPFFSHCIDGDALDLDDAGETLPGFVGVGGLAAAHERLERLDDDEIAFQIRLIRGSVEARLMRMTGHHGTLATRKTTAGPPASDGTEAANRIAARLVDLAIQDPTGPVEWLGTDLGKDGQHFTYGPVGLSLYGGAIGIACLLAHLEGQPGGPPAAARLRSAVLAPIRDIATQSSDAARLRWWRDQPLGLNGCAGQLLGLLDLGEDGLVDTLLDAARPGFVESDRQFDLLGGCAGIVGPLLRRGSTQAVELAVLAGDHLLTHQHEDGGWREARAIHSVLGFAHGTAGVAAALARLHAETGQTRFRDGAIAAVTLERSKFVPGEQNWPDMRVGVSIENGPQFMQGWCGGPAGIAMGRASLFGTALWDDRCVEEIEIALATTAEVEQLPRDHLCCGNLGLMLALRILCDGPWPIAEEARAKARNAVDRHRERALARCIDDHIDLYCFSTDEGSLVLPGFFTGLSGMALSLIEGPGPEATAATLFGAGLLPWT